MKDRGDSSPGDEAYDWADDPDVDGQALANRLAGLEPVLVVGPALDPEKGSTAAVSDAERLARRFHEEYERLAPQHGYETRKASAKPWSQVPEQNRALMTATVQALIDAGDLAASSRPRLESVGEPEDYGFRVKRDESGEGWIVDLPFRCDEWPVCGDDFTPRGGLLHGQAVEALREFVSQAQAALAELEAGRELNPTRDKFGTVW